MPLSSEQNVQVILYLNLTDKS